MPLADTGFKQQPTEGTNKKNVSVDNSDPITAAVELSKEKVAKWIDNNNDTLEKIRIQTAFEFKSGETSLGPSYLSKQIASAAKYGITSDVFSSGEPISSPSQKAPPHHNYYGQHIRFVPIHPGSVPPGTVAPPQHKSVSDMVYPGPVQLIPIAGNQPVMANGGTSPGVPYVVHVPSTINNTNDSGEHTNEDTKPDTPNSNPDENIVSGNECKEENSPDDASIGEKRTSAVLSNATTMVKPEKIKKLERSSGGIEVAASYTANGKETYDNHLSRVELSLVNENLWEKFYNTGTEMILTRTGR